jgi:lipopolysaccharide export system permease protein
LKIIDRYVATEFLKVFTISLMGFILVFLLVEVTDKIKYYFEHNPSGWLMFKYFLVKLPGYLFFAIPLAILMGGMLSLLMLARHSEIVAMQANGIDALTIGRPVLTIGLIASLVLFLVNETIVPWSNRYSEYIQDVEIAGKKNPALFRSDQIWLRSPDSVTYVRKFDASKNTLEQVTIVRWDQDYAFTERLAAEKAKWWGDHWILYGVNRTHRTQDGGFAVDVVPSMAGPITKGPEEFGRAEQLAVEMNLTQLSAHIDQIMFEGQMPTRYLVDWHSKLAFPFVCLIMAALSLPFAIKVNPREGGMAVGLALSLVVAFSYWIVHTMFVALGHGGYIPPVVAAWAANIIFGLTATVLVLHAGT